MNLSNVVGWSSLAAGIACLVIALILAMRDEGERKKAKEAVKAAADKTTASTKDDATFKQQAGPLSTTLDSVGKLAAALKDLDRVAQLLSVSIGFFGVAAVAAGLESVANAIAK